MNVQQGPHERGARALRATDENKRRLANHPHLYLLTWCKIPALARFTLTFLIILTIKKPRKNHKKQQNEQILDKIPLSIRQIHNYSHTYTFNSQLLYIHQQKNKKKKSDLFNRYETWIFKLGISERSIEPKIDQVIIISSRQIVPERDVHARERPQLARVKPSRVRPGPQRVGVHGPLDLPGGPLDLGDLDSAADERLMPQEVVGPRHVQKLHHLGHGPIKIQHQSLIVNDLACARADSLTLREHLAVEIVPCLHRRSLVRLAQLPSEVSQTGDELRARIPNHVNELGMWEERVKVGHLSKNVGVLGARAFFLAGRLSQNRVHVQASRVVEHVHGETSLQQGPQTPQTVVDLEDFEQKHRL